MSNQIKSLVERHIPAGYRGTREVTRAVDGIVRDLDGVRANIARQVQAAARTKGVSEQEVNEFLIGCGLVDRPAPAPRAAAPTAGGVQVDGTLARLVEFARQHGFRG